MKFVVLALVAFTLIFGSACVPASAQEAQVLIWGMDADNNWNNPDNWTPDGVALGPVPGALDHAIIHEGISPPVFQPLITGAPATTVNILTPSWFDDHTTTLDIGPGGSINTTGFTRLSAGDRATSTVNFLPGAGISVWNILQMSFNNSDQETDGGMPQPGEEADSFINLDGGILHLGSLGFSNNGSNTTNIDIGTEGLLLVNGDHTDTGSGAGTSWINAGYLTALDGDGTVGVAYDSENGRTVFNVQTSDLAADFDNDGDVDAGDLARWGLDYDEMNDFSDADGDFDSDGSDFLYWQRTITGPLGTLSAVPEPSCIALLALAGLGSLARRNRTLNV